MVKLPCDSKYFLSYRLKRNWTNCRARATCMCTYVPKFNKHMLCTLLSKLYYINAQPPARGGGLEMGIPRGCPAARTSKSLIARSWVATDVVTLTSSPTKDWISAAESPMLGSMRPRSTQCFLDAIFSIAQCRQLTATFGRGALSRPHCPAGPAADRQSCL